MRLHNTLLATVNGSPWNDLHKKVPQVIYEKDTLNPLFWEQGYHLIYCLYPKLI